jgi:hypothetical protein
MQVWSLWFLTRSYGLLSSNSFSGVTGGQKEGVVFLLLGEHVADVCACVRVGGGGQYYIVRRENIYYMSRWIFTLFVCCLKM